MAVRRGGRARKNEEGLGREDGESLDFRSLPVIESLEQAIVRAAENSLFASPSTVALF